MSDPVLEAIKLLRNEVGMLSTRFGAFADAQLELQRETVTRLNRIDASLVDLKRRIDTAMLILVEIGQQQNISRELGDIRRAPIGARRRSGWQRVTDSRG
jgi:hypothetical protein